MGSPDGSSDCGLFRRANDCCDQGSFVPYCSHARDPQDQSGTGGGRQQHLDIGFPPVLFCPRRLPIDCPRRAGRVFGGRFSLALRLSVMAQEVVVFDAGKRQAQRGGGAAPSRPASGVVPFSEITGIGMEASAAGNNVLTYRLTILTSGRRCRCRIRIGGTSRDAIRSKRSLQFLHLDGEELSSSGVAHENSIQSLLRQGRKLDAIELVRASEKIGLTEAVNLVNQIDEKMKAAK